jgi:hypothetical protein
MSGFVIELTTKAHDGKLYVGAVEVQSDDDVQSFEVTPFGSLAEASEHAFPSVEAATQVLFDTFPETKNTEYAIVPALGAAPRPA